MKQNGESNNTVANRIVVAMWIDMIDVLHRFLQVPWPHEQYSKYIPIHGKSVGKTGPVLERTVGRVLITAQMLLALLQPQSGGALSEGGNQRKQHSRRTYDMGQK